MAAYDEASGEITVTPTNGVEDIIYTITIDEDPEIVVTDLTTADFPYVHCFDAPGDYEIVVTALDACGRTAFDSVAVEVTTCHSCDLPDPLYAYATGGATGCFAIAQVGAEQYLGEGSYTGISSPVSIALSCTDGVWTLANYTSKTLCDIVGSSLTPGPYADPDVVAIFTVGLDANIDCGGVATFTLTIRKTACP